MSDTKGTESEERIPVPARNVRAGAICWEVGTRKWREVADVGTWGRGGWVPKGTAMGNQQWKATVGQQSGDRGRATAECVAGEQDDVVHSPRSTYDGFQIPNLDCAVRDQRSASAQ